MMLMVGAMLPQAWAAEKLPLIQNVNAYESMSLNGEWNYIVDVQEEGYYDYRMKPYCRFLVTGTHRMSVCSSTRVLCGLRRASRLCRCRSVARCSTLGL